MVRPSLYNNSDVILTRYSERKNERRELVESHQSELEQLRKQVEAAEKAALSAKQTLETTRKELERAIPFEKEVKEKNLLIGKLRHEAVTLNEHLTKALRILKKGRPEDNVDRQIVTNYILHFLAIDRSDPKKFEALQLIASLLNWNDGTSILTFPGLCGRTIRLPSPQSNESKLGSPVPAHLTAIYAFRCRHSGVFHPLPRSTVL
jgi:hypothetical protein